MEPHIKNMHGFVASAVGATTAWSGFLAGEFLHGLLANLAMLLGCILTVATIIFAWNIHRIKRKTESIDEASKAAKLCADCREGRRPSICPLSQEERPADCFLKPQHKIKPRKI